METLNYCVSALTTELHSSDAEFMVLFIVLWLVASVLQNKFETNNEE
ncbi:hypothetical protein [Rheinheimera soli]|uniref:Uncharacterized protein n=1 Tax=Rheinheimera soli TaxID=443616 RepID=A0ABU1W0Q9_9GAMM|nr:hypothetical protein [Rheinheimera soli]MDR7121308.1 hypothetical protein [Rheinheimera soli]